MDTSVEMHGGPKPYLSGHKANQAHPPALIHCFLKIIKPEAKRHSFSLLSLPGNVLCGTFAYHWSIESSINVGWSHLPLPSAIPPPLDGNILLLKRDGTRPIVLCSQLMTSITVSFGLEKHVHLPGALPLVIGLCNVIFTGCLPCAVIITMIIFPTYSYY